jgi:hypothetical protein
MRHFNRSLVKEIADEKSPPENYTKATQEITRKPEGQAASSVLYNFASIIRSTLFTLITIGLIALAIVGAIALADPTIRRMLFEIISQYI